MPRPLGIVGIIAIINSQGVAFSYPLRSDRMKSFHSKMMMCDVLAEREAQVNLKEELERSSFLVRARSVRVQIICTEV